MGKKGCQTSAAYIVALNDERKLAWCKKNPKECVSETGDNAS